MPPADEERAPRMVPRLVEVTPRDTLQCAALLVPTEDKVWACERLKEAGFPMVEVTTFRPDLASLFPDAEEVLRRLDLGRGYRALVYGEEAARRCAEAGLREVVVNFASSPAYEKGLGRTHAEALETEKRGVRLLRERGIRVVASMSASCGDGTPDHAGHLARTLDAVEESGPDEVVLVDTYSLADPEKALELLGRLRDRFPQAVLAVHFHDGGGRGVENTLACARAGAEVLEFGMRLDAERRVNSNADTAEGLAALKKAGFSVPEGDEGALEEVRRRLREKGTPIR